jgi:hypothetical protein
MSGHVDAKRTSGLTLSRSEWVTLTILCTVGVIVVRNDQLPQGVTPAQWCARIQDLAAENNEMVDTEVHATKGLCVATNLRMSPNTDLITTLADAALRERAAEGARQKNNEGT